MYYEVWNEVLSVTKSCTLKQLAKAMRKWRNLGLLYEERYGCDFDTTEAFGLYTIATLQGDSQAQSNL